MKYSTRIVIMLSIMSFAAGTVLVGMDDKYAINTAKKDRALDQRLFEAVKKCAYQETVDLITQGADVNARGMYKTPVLMQVVSRNNPKLIKLLIENGADVNAQDENGRTALIRACLFQQLENIKVLLKAPDIDITIRDWSRDNGITALEMAEGIYRYDIAQLLRDHLDTKKKMRREKDFFNAAKNNEGKHKKPGADTFFDRKVPEVIEEDHLTKRAKTSVKKDQESIPEKDEIQQEQPSASESSTIDIDVSAIAAPHHHEADSINKLWRKAIAEKGKLKSAARIPHYEADSTYAINWQPILETNLQATIAQFNHRIPDVTNKPMRKATAEKGILKPAARIPHYEADSTYAINWQPILETNLRTTIAQFKQRIPDTKNKPARKAAIEKNMKPILQDPFLELDFIIESTEDTPQTFTAEDILLNSKEITSSSLPDKTFGTLDKSANQFILSPDPIAATSSSANVGILITETSHPELFNKANRFFEVIKPYEQKISLLSRDLQNALDTSQSRAYLLLKEIDSFDNKEAQEYASNILLDVALAIDQKTLATALLLSKKANPEYCIFSKDQIIQSIRCITPENRIEVMDKKQAKKWADFLNNLKAFNQKYCK